MTLILKQSAQLLAALIALYCVLLAVSLLLVPRNNVGERLDAAHSAASLFLTEPKYVFLARSRLNTTADKVLLLGASNTVSGFRQAQVQALLPTVEVHNIAVSGSNITQLSQIVDLVREVQSPETRRHNIYVLGLWYGIFASDKARWYTPDRHAGDTDIDIERYRYGFFRRTAAGPVPLLPPRYLSTGALLIQPYLVLDRSVRDMTRSVRDLMSGKEPTIIDEQRDKIVLDEAAQRKYLDFWRDYTGHAQTLGEQPFQTLQRMIDGILAEGGRVVIVDMPIPTWHSQGSPLAADYRQRMDTLLPLLEKRPGVAVLNMTDANVSNDFIDEVHPKPRVTKQWAQRLATTLLATTANDARINPQRTPQNNSYRHYLTQDTSPRPAIAEKGP